MDENISENTVPEPSKTKKPKPKRAKAWRKAVLDAVVTCSSVRSACDAVGISEGHVYRVRAQDPQFEVEFQNALDLSLKNLEQEAFRRAKKGSDRLVEFLLARRDPRYKNKEELQLGGNIDIKVEFTRDDADKTS